MHTLYEDDAVNHCHNYIVICEAVCLYREPSFHCDLTDDLPYGFTKRYLCNRKRSSLFQYSSLPLLQQTLRMPFRNM